MADLLERENLLALLDRLAARARRRGGVVFVGGEAGAGKTSLLERFVADRADLRVLRGACEALATPRPLGPLHDIAPGCGADVARLLASSTAANPSSLFAATLAELGRPPLPTVFVIEDLHWADAATLDLLKYLGRRIRRVPALLLASHRDDAASIERLLPLLGELPPDDVHRLAVPPLSRAAVEQLAGPAARHDAARLHAATGGNAFFVSELLRQARSPDGGVGVPLTVRDAVLARAAALPAGARQVLDVVSTRPVAADLALVEAVLEPGVEAVDACLAAGLLVAEDGRRLRFRHELARTAIETAIAPRRAAQWHARVLEALAADVSNASLADLAHHAQRAGDAEAVLRWAPAAAREAAARGARREAAAHLRAALAHGDRLDDAARAVLLDELAAHRFELNELDAAIEAGEAAVALHARQGDPARQSASLSALAMARVRTLRNDAADAASRRAIDLAATLRPAGRPLACALATESYLRMLDRDHRESILHGEHALSLAERAGDAATAARAALSVGTATMFVDFDRGVARLTALLDVARRLDDGGVLLADTHQMLATASAELHGFDVAERHFEEGLAVARRFDLDRVAGYLEGWRAMVDVLRGRWPAAGERATAAVRTQESGSTNRVIALVALARLRVRRGEPGADALLDEALALAERSGTLQRLGPVAAARAEAAWTRGDAAATAREAARALDLAAAKRHAWLLGELAFWQWRAAGASPSRVSGAAGVAVGANALAAPYRLQIDGDWRAAAAAWRELGTPYEVARALADGDEAARREALVILDRLGARPLAERIRQQLRRAGTPAVPRGAQEATRRHPAGLTRREAEILELIGHGLRNAQIAQRLSRSTRTVEHHVEALLGKLEAGTRDEAVAVARARGLLPKNG